MGSPSIQNGVSANLLLVMYSLRVAEINNVSYGVYCDGTDAFTCYLHL